ncbi:hypothetical protein SH2C18_38800 [Clostridium sediminicola]|uniref:hypothetical protein n=1 Tax=Clostridium sediminicola TaxID=3114879 RepID=UPI0031F20CEF
MKLKNVSLLIMILTNVMICFLLVIAVSTKEGMERFLFIILLVSMFLTSSLVGYGCVKNNKSDNE